MNTKIKTLFFALFLVISATVNAQDTPKKYEYATVKQKYNAHILVSYAGKPMEDMKLSDAKSDNDHHELLAYVENLQNEGWEVFNSTEITSEHGIDIFTFILRREKK